MAKMREIEVFEETAERLEAEAARRGIALSELLAELVRAGGEHFSIYEVREEGRSALSRPFDDPEDAKSWAEYQKDGIGVPWEEARAWMESWFTKDELPQPKPRKL